MSYITYSSIAIAFGFMLDYIFADPYNFPHIIRWVGSFIAFLDKKMKRTVVSGTLLVITTIAVFTVPAAILLYFAYKQSIVLAIVLESLIAWQMLAAKSLKLESMKVYESLQQEDIEKARRMLSYIVGRDTKDLDEKAIIRACVETVAENTADGVTAPLFYMFLFGAIGALTYKCVNTMDSMVGYKNEKYLEFGKAAAKIDDFLNYIPSRISALFMAGGAFFLGYDASNAFKIWKRDRKKHASPNSAQTESACAGALNIQLAGPASYLGVVQQKEYIGDDDREVENEDIKRASRLMYATSLLFFVFFILLRLLIWAVFNAKI